MLCTRDFQWVFGIILVYILYDYVALTVKSILYDLCISVYFIEALFIYITGVYKTAGGRRRLNVLAVMWERAIPTYCRAHIISGRKQRYIQVHVAMKTAIKTLYT